MADDWDLNAVVRSCNNHQMKSNNNHHHENTTLSTFNAPTTPQTQNDNHFPKTRYYNYLSDMQYFTRDPPQYIYQNNLTPATTTNTINNIIVTPNIINNNNTSQFLDFGGFSGQQQYQSTVVSRGNPVLVPRPVPQGYSRMDHNLRAVQNSNMQMPPKPKPPKKKDSVKKTIRLVTKENLNTDVWTWRKYGRKPIKGSPYPRNYYRCSSSKRCLARKQMERSCNEPDLYILTFTGEHCHAIPTHRNPLAGTTRAAEEDDVADTASSSSSSSPPSVPDFDGLDLADLNFDLFDDVFFGQLYYN